MIVPILVSLTLLVLVLIALFGDLPNYRGTFIHTIHIHLNRLFHKVALLFYLIDDKLFNRTLSSPRVISVFLWISKWLVPLFYIVVMGQCIKLFFSYTYKQILSYDQKTNWQLRLCLIIIPVITTNFYLFLNAVFRDPGHINSSDSKYYEEFPYNNIIFFPNMECSTCLTVKPARSKHCATCDRCILMFDHHCIWLNNDVGYYNYRYFFMFLVNIVITLVYGSYLCFYSLYCFFNYTENLPPEFTQNWTVMNYWNIICYSTFENEISGILLLMACLICPVIIAFLLEHIKSIYLGVTTSEILKWDFISELIKNKWLFLHTHSNNGNITKTFIVLNKTNWDGSPVFVKLENEKHFPVQSIDQLTRIDSWDDLTNIYDNGFWKNLKQKLFPNPL